MLLVRSKGWESLFLKVFSFKNESVTLVFDMDK